MIGWLTSLRRLGSSLETLSVDLRYATEQIAEAQRAQDHRSRLLQGTFYGTGIMTPYLCAIVGCHSHVSMDMTESERVWKDISIEGTETT